MWLDWPAYVVYLDQDGLRRIILLSSTLRNFIQGYARDISIGWSSLVDCEGVVIELTLCVYIILFVMLICLEILRLGLGGVHIR